MSYVSIFKNIPEILSQPTGIAAIASLGIHGAIALIVPLMPVNTSASSKADSPKAVGLMELSTADQSRLPQPPSTSQVALQQATGSRLESFLVYDFFSPFPCYIS